MNDADSSKIKNLMSNMKIGTTNDPKDADIILLNTCSIRWKAEHKVYSMLGTFKDIKKSRPDIIIGVGGCVAQQEQDEMFRKVPHLDIVFGTHNVHRLPEMISRVQAERCKVEETDFFDSPEPLVYPAPEEDGVRAFVNIIRGCNNYCTYCIVPYVRGREASRSSIEIVDEVKALAESGVKEVTLLGQNVNSYGNDLGDDIDFPGLLKKVAAVEGITRLRFTTSHPKDLSEELIQAFGEIELLANHLHLPVQSGSDKVLAAMKRGYTAASYMKNVEKLRKVRPDIAISTDMIVGFPGEDDIDFQKTLALMKEVVYDSAFYFKYSVRPGTAAAKLQDDVPEDLKSERLTSLQALQKGHSIARNKAEEGTVQMVLVEGIGRKHSSFLTGRNSGNKVVNFAGPDDFVGQIVPVRITGSTANALKGEILPLH